MNWRDIDDIKHKLYILQNSLDDLDVDDEVALEKTFRAMIRQCQLFLLENDINL